jgi:hypothetical protein
VEICNPLPSQPDIPVPDGPDGPPPTTEPAPEAAPALGHHLVLLRAAHDLHAAHAGVQETRELFAVLSRTSRRAIKPA